MTESPRDKFTVAVVIPAYNEEKTIAKIIVQSSKQADKVIVCDDGSKDLTAEIAEKLGATVIKHGKNMGKGAALLDLFAKANDLGADIIVTLDADAQHDPDDIPRLVSPMIYNNADIVIGSRTKLNEMPYYRRLGNKILNLSTNRLAGGQVSKDSQSGFRAYSKRALDSIKVTEMSMSVESQMLIEASKKNLRIVDIPITVRYRNVRASKLNPVSHMLNLLSFLYGLALDRKPILYIGVPGMILIIIGVVFGVRVLEIFSRTGLIAVGSALLAVGLTVLGVLLSLTALILHMLLRILKRMNTPVEGAGEGEYIYVLSDGGNSLTTKSDGNNDGDFDDIEEWTGTNDLVTVWKRVK